MLRILSFFQHMRTPIILGSVGIACAYALLSCEVGLKDPLRAGVWDGSLSTLSCWDDDRLRSVELLDNETVVWMARASSIANTLSLDQPVRIAGLSHLEGFETAGTFPEPIPSTYVIRIVTTSNYLSFKLGDSYPDEQLDTDC